MDPFPKRLLQAPSGFPDLGPREAIAQRYMLGIIRTQFERAGYVPIETSLVERPEVLLAKGGGEISAQVYGLRLMNPAPDAEDDTKNLALRFDQTVPLARFVAAQQGNLTFPFRRYAIGPVFRGERPKSGRYRQFTQADIDVIGDGSLSLLHDAEMVGVISGIFTELAIGPFTIRIGNRKVLEGILGSTGLSSELVRKASGVIDRIEKIGIENALVQLTELGMEKDRASEILGLLTDARGTSAILASLREGDFGPLFAEGVQELSRVISAVRQLGVPEERFRVDISIARGLDYYTGTVYETRFDAYPELGSIASGGRYENLASTFVNRSLPGVGISIGVTRLLLRLIEAGLLPAESVSIARVLVTTGLGAESFGAVYLDQARRLREAGVPVEVYLEERPLAKQLQFASRRGFDLALITREEDIASEMLTVKHLKTSHQYTIPSADLETTIHRLLKDT